MERQRSSERHETITETELSEVASDHVIFLGPGAVALPTNDGILAERVPAAARESSLFAVSPSPEPALLLALDATCGADEFTPCSHLVLGRVPDDAASRYLTTGQKAKLLD